MREYLPTLQRRRNARVGDLVFLAEDKVVNDTWPMGQVVEVYTGEGRGVRSALVKTAGGVFHRPVTKRTTGGR